MKAQIILSLILISIIANISLSQQQPIINQQQLLQQVIKPTFIVEDVVIALQILNNIEITGNEIDAFLNVKRTLQAIIKRVQDSSMQTTDQIRVEITVQTAQDMLTFLQRGKFSGQVAEKYKRFIDAIVESAKALSQTTKK